MKTKTLALSFILSMTGFAVFAQTDSMPPMPKDTTVPTTDSIPKKDSSLALNYGHYHLNNFNVIVRDTVPPTDTVPSTDTTKKDSSLVYYNAQNNRLIAYSSLQRDTIPNGTDTTKTDTSRTDSSMVFNLKSHSEAFTYAIRDTVPSDTDSTVPADTTKKDSSMVFNLISVRSPAEFSYAQRDTIPSDSDTTVKKDSSLALHIATPKLSATEGVIRTHSQIIFAKKESAVMKKESAI